MKVKHLLPIITVVSAFGALFLTGCGQSANGNATQVQSQATPAPFTGQVYEVKMRGTATKYFFEPNNIVIKRGDKVRFTMSEGGPHNVSFSNQKIPEGAQMLLEGQGKLVGALMQAPGQSYEIEFTKNMPLGEYNFVCDPHNALGMKGKITVTY